MLSLMKVGHRDLERYYPLMETDFDSEEMLSRLAIHKGMLNGSIELLVLRDTDSLMDAGYALLLTKNLYGYVDLKYMAPDPDPDRLRKLRKFFNRFGYEEIKSDYTIRGVKANLLVKPMQGRADIAPIAHRILPDFYSRFLSANALWGMMEIKKSEE